MKAPARIDRGLEAPSAVAEKRRRAASLLALGRRQGGLVSDGGKDCGTDVQSESPALDVRNDAYSWRYSEIEQQSRVRDHRQSTYARRDCGPTVIVHSEAWTEEYTLGHAGG
ncbi:hypothetical protein CCUS01_15253 [Colletotrichum cuscutae]|uniref:Uncharacterized protein n=1 Tax=Colletotrichum cuscutae TaxID=1209917 RepID=A0AAI9Y869_9PEZI|nr:hypothetical protein CCUS01_15253 [Colletotrichum cuscutae]